MADYLDKEEFLADISAYKERKKRNPDEPISDYSANAIMMIAKGIANRPNFSGYSYKQDMISDAIYAMLRYFDKFDPHHPASNPFGYFSRITWFAFLQRIAKEKKQVAIKGKILAMVPFDTFDVQDQDLDQGFKNSFTEFLQEHNFVELAPKTKKKQQIEVDEENEVDNEDNVDPDSPDMEVLLALASDSDGEDESYKGMDLDGENA